MEMRAREETGMARDLIPALAPLAVALHDSFLRSRCSSCFQSSSRATATSLSCCACGAPLLYCSHRCFASDSGPHSASSECLLLALLAQSPPPTWHPGDTADLRSALRLLYAFETLGFLPDPNRDVSPTRIGGLLVSGLEDVLQEGGEMAERIREGAELMSRARSTRTGGGGGGVSLEEVVLWAVLTNAVEVQSGDEGALGIAVYGPQFSWFNHSCSPNACYRSELASTDVLLGSCEPDSLRVFPAGAGEEISMWKWWSCGTNRLPNGLCNYAPRIIVRSIKPIKKGEEVCITYTDLLRPKAVRHFDMWSKYRFICSCVRCIASPQMYIDYVLNNNASSCELGILNSDNSCKDAEFTELADFIDQAIEDYMTNGDPEACCKKLEKLLFEGSQDEQLQAVTLQRNFVLHPLHHLSFNAYIMLASAYRTRATDLDAISLGEENILETSKMGRAAAAYSLLLAGATNHLFLSEPSLITNAALYWISAGESVLNLVRNPIWGSAIEMNKSDFGCVSGCPWCTMRDGSSVSCVEFKAALRKFLECASSILMKSWPFLTQGFLHMENIKSIVDFSWFELASSSPQIVFGVKGAAECKEHYHIRCQYRAETSAEEERTSLFLLAVHCLNYGTYLASICYGPECYLVHHARALLNSSRLSVVVGIINSGLPS